MSPTPPPTQPMSKEQELQMLKEQTQVLEDQLRMIGQRIEELSKKGN
jgi:prefoldin subunit 5